MRRVQAAVSEEDYRDQAAASVELEEVEVELDMVAVAPITDWAASIMV